MIISINEDQWNVLSSDEQERIVAAFRKAELIEQGDTIAGVRNAPVEEDDKDGDENAVKKGMEGWNPKKEICKKVCDAAAASAAGWCTANTSGAGLVACLAAAEIARKKCRKRC